MARIRSIKPEFWTSEQVVECSTTARLLFIGMWNFCDDQGVHPASLKTLKMEIFPGDDIATSDLDGFVRQLIKVGLLSQFRAQGRDYWAVTGWHHQKIEKPNRRHPSPKDGEILQPIGDRSPSIRLPVADHSTPESTGEEGKGRESTESNGDTASSEVDGRSVDPPPLESEHVPQCSTREGAMAVQLRRWERERGKATRIQSGNPKLAEFASKGITDEQLREAYDLAVADREVTDDPSAINLGFLSIFIEKILSPPAARASPDRWQSSSQGIERKGKELGVLARAGESYSDYARRIDAVLSKQNSLQWNAA